MEIKQTQQGDSIDEMLRKVRIRLRQSMDGMCAQSMRQKGIHYKVNFGVDILTLRRIAKECPRNRALAEAMWQKDVRELKILATLVYPENEFQPQTARQWAEDIAYQEIREQLCMNLLQDLPYANELVSEWIVAEKWGLRATGYWLFARLAMICSPLVEKVSMEKLLTCAVADLHADELFLRQAALGALKRAGRQSPENGRRVLEMLGDFEDATTSWQREVYEALYFEFDLF